MPVRACRLSLSLNVYNELRLAAATQINCSLLSVSVNAMLIPAAFHFASSTMNGASLDDQRRAIINMSRAVSVVLILSEFACALTSRFIYANSLH